MKALCIALTVIILAPVAIVCLMIASVFFAGCSYTEKGQAL